MNPYAPRLTFLDTRTRTRRDHEKYLTLIDAVALLHQHQRPVHRVERSGQVIEYVEVEAGDIEIANRLAGEVLGRSLDELPPQTRRVLSLLDAWVTAECGQVGSDRGEFRFTTREVRDALELGQTQAKIHLARLVDLEYLVLHRAVPGRPHIYELIYRGEGGDGRSFLPGLLDHTELDDPRYDPKRSGPEDQRPGCGRPRAGPWTGAGRGARDRPDLLHGNGSGRSAVASAPAAYEDDASKSYVAAGRDGGRP